MADEMATGTGTATPRSVSMYKVGFNGPDKGNGGKAFTFQTLLPEICMNFGCLRNVIVKKEVQKDTLKIRREEKNVTKRQKSRIMPLMASSETAKMVGGSILSRASKSASFLDPSYVVVIAIYDTQDHLIEIAFNRVSYGIPQIVIKAVGAILPCLPKLEKITIKNCTIDRYVLHEVNKIQYDGYLTEITLESVPYLGEMLAELLEHDVKILTLCRCQIDDVVCEKIALKLGFCGATEKTLQCLNLASNKITDLGAKYLADALRTNQTLRSLNLADNLITDEGANLILNVLHPFPLTQEELYAKRSRYMAYCKIKRDLVNKYFKEIKNREHIGPKVQQPNINRSTSSVRQHLNRSASSIRNRPTFSTTKLTAKKKKGSTTQISKKESKEFAKKISSMRLSMDQNYMMRAEAIASDKMGPFKDPFNKINTIKKDDWLHCRGNLVLASLNLSYNKLSYSILKPIENMLVDQENLKLLSESGLLRLVIEGNKLPKECTEMVNINNILAKKVDKFSYSR